MQEELILNNNDITKNDVRNNIINFEQQLKEQEGAFIGDNELCPLKHTFSDGIYIREIFIPSGTYIVGKLHKHEHPNFLMSGTVDVVTEAGVERLVGPLSMISPAGTKRALRAITDLVWITVHHNPTNTEDLNKLEKNVIADSYEEYDQYKKIQGNKVVSLWNKIIKRLI